MVSIRSAGATPRTWYRFPPRSSSPTRTTSVSSAISGPPTDPPGRRTSRGRCRSRWRAARTCRSLGSTATPRRRCATAPSSVDSDSSTVTSSTASAELGCREPAHELVERERLELVDEHVAPDRSSSNRTLVTCAIAVDDASRMAFASAGNGSPSGSESPPQLATTRPDARTNSQLLVVRISASDLASA